MFRKHNFYAGPAILPLYAINKAKESLEEFNNSGIGILEISHRSKEFDEVLNSATARAKRLYNIPDNYDVIFVQGGASMVMAMIALNFIPAKSKVQYIDTGRWSQRAITEAKRKNCDVEILWSGKESAYSVLPDVQSLSYDDNASFIHITSNNTIAGTQFKEFPKTKAPLFVDMSSDFFSRPIDVSQFAMIYGGVQKNIGPAGAAMVIIRKELLERIPAGLSEMLNFKVYVEKNSLYNTPPAFSIYMVSLVLEWLEEEIGGLDKINEKNKAKASVLYNAINNSGGFYKAVVSNPEHQSLMNVTFRLQNEALEKKLIAEATNAGFIGLKGHRSVGGLRASIYNACPTESVEALSQFLKDFMVKNG